MDVVGLSHSAPRSSSVLTSWAQLIVDALEAEGHDADEVLRSVGLERGDLAALGGRQPLSSTRALWHAAVATFGDPACGLKISRHVRFTTFHALGYAVLASSTLREALHRLLRFSRVVSDAHEFRVETAPDGLRLVILPCRDGDGRTRPVGPETVDAVMSLILRTCRLLAGRAFCPLSLEQRRSRPIDPAPYERFFRCALRFGASEDALTFDTGELDQPLPTGNAALARHNELLLEQQIEALAQGQLADKVRKILERWGGEVPAGDVARLVGLSERSFQRRLKEEGTSYVRILAESREQMARTYLRQSDRSIDDVALRLGFYSSSSFARAFV